jgi:hypothetical protein
MKMAKTGWEIGYADIGHGKQPMRMNDGGMVICEHAVDEADGFEYVKNRVVVSLTKEVQEKTKRGQHWLAQDKEQEALANRICEFLNKPA